MKKLALDVDALTIQTFVPIPEDADVAQPLGTRVTRCYSECNACGPTQQFTNEIDCAC